MANSPNPDFISEIMETEFGTRVLITNSQADVYLARAANAKKKVNEETVDPDIYSRWCGGAGGFDVLVERFEDQ